MKYQKQRPSAITQQSAYSGSSSSNRASVQSCNTQTGTRSVTHSKIRAGKRTWDPGYESDEECCRVNFGWDETSDYRVGTVTTTDVSFGTETDSKTSSEASS